MKILRAIWKPISEHLIWYIVGLGLIFFLIGKSMLGQNSMNWGELFYDLGKLLLGGGAFAAIVKSEQFSKIFHNELRNIVYSDEHLAVRDDLDTIWEKVTKSLTKQKFSAISSKMQENVKKYFLPIEHDYYYNDTKIKIDIELDPDNPEYILVTEKYSTTIICEDETLNICYRFSGGIPFENGNQDYTFYKLKSFKLNGKTKDTAENMAVKHEDGHLLVDFQMNLCGSKKYAIIREESKRYHLKLNTHRQQLATWVYNNLSLDLHYPKEMEIELFNLGVLQAWNVEKHSNNYKRIEAEYKGLIYKNQGCILYLCKS